MEKITASLPCGGWRWKAGHSCSGKLNPLPHGWAFSHENQMCLGVWVSPPRHRVTRPRSRECSCRKALRGAGWGGGSVVGNALACSPPPPGFLFARRPSNHLNMGATGLTQGPQIHVCPSSSQRSFSKARIGQSPNLSSVTCEKFSLCCTFICSIYCRSG